MEKNFRLDQFCKNQNRMIEIIASLMYFITEDLETIVALEAAISTAIPNLRLDQSKHTQNAELAYTSAPLPLCHILVAGLSIRFWKPNCSKAITSVTSRAAIPPAKFHTFINMKIWYPVLKQLCKTQPISLRVWLPKAGSAVDFQPVILCVTKATKVVDPAM